MGDCVESLRALDAGSVHCCVTSPPYWGLRDYGNDGQIGLEETPAAYVARLVDVFREVRRVLRDDGTLWLNLGDSYASSPASGGKSTSDKFCPNIREQQGTVNGKRRAAGLVDDHATPSAPYRRPLGLKPKDLVGIPWRVAFALQADGWYLRSDIIWHKPNPMPESVTDRPTKAHEYLFLLSKSARYFYDAEAIKTSVRNGGKVRRGPIYSIPAETIGVKKKTGNMADDAVWRTPTKANKRSVWTVPTRPYGGAHFAVFPTKLIEPCILAGCPVGGTVLDPFGGSGTTAIVALNNQRRAVLCELSPDYIEIAHDRIGKATRQRSIFDVLAEV
tara:strand:- start:542 stop:1537 length:996 start_codon:yes stop_codon:yes gene_type:complete